MTKSIRESLEETFNVAEDKEETGGSGEDTKEPVGDPGEETPEEKPEEKPELETEEEPEEEESEEPEPEPEETQESEEDDTRAPESWKPAIREHWKKLPKDVKNEITRREKDISGALFKASGHRKLAEEYVSLVRPYEKYIRMANSTPYQAIDNMLRTAAHLSDGTPTQKAQVIRDIIKNYDVDIEILDSVLAGEELPNTANDAVIQAMEKRFAPMLEFFEKAQGNQKQYQTDQAAKVQKEIEDFAGNKANEFYEDVREDMADLIEMAERRGRKMTLKEAYDRACQADPEISKIITQRSAAVTEEKRRAASSLPSGGTNSGGGKKEGASLRDTLNNAWEEAAT
jgi:hypothetical protein